MRALIRLLRFSAAMALLAVVFLGAVELSDRPDEAVQAKIEQTGTELLQRAQELRARADEAVRTEGEAALEKIRRWRDEASKLEDSAGKATAERKDRLRDQGLGAAAWARKKAVEAWERIERNIAWLRERLREARGAG